MLKKRIIPCLDVQNGRTVKGVNFVDIRDAGNAVDLASRYMEEGADELVFLDITATVENRSTLVELVEEVAKTIRIPFTVGGGIRKIADAAILLEAGADKVSVNSAAVDNPLLIEQLASNYGSQCVVVAVDTNRVDDEWYVYVHGGRTRTEKKTLDWVQECQERGAGEILLTAMTADGTKNGFALDITGQVSQMLDIPVIASGGAGELTHFKSVFEETNASAALAATIFHFREVPIPELKHYLAKQNIPVHMP